LELSSLSSFSLTVLDFIFYFYVFPILSCFAQLLPQ
jgi:hypothetical protein